MSYLIKISQFAGKTFAIWVILFAILGFAFPSVAVHLDRPLYYDSAWRDYVWHGIDIVSGRF
ncbi:hypothetical protein CHCC20442_4448 [Bacillus licheniformis]|nr:hypothetical protein CHCC20442_4448 [Bacillus licheniformis]